MEGLLNNNVFSLLCFDEKRMKACMAHAIACGETFPTNVQRIAKDATLLTQLPQGVENPDDQVVCDAIYWGLVDEIHAVMPHS